MKDEKQNNLRDSLESTFHVSERKDVNKEAEHTIADVVRSIIDHAPTWMQPKISAFMQREDVTSTDALGWPADSHCGKEMIKRLDHIIETLHTWDPSSADSLFNALAEEWGVIACG